MKMLAVKNAPSSAPMNLARKKSNSEFKESTATKVGVTAHVDSVRLRAMLDKDAINVLQ